MSKIPSQPENLFSDIFANQGVFSIIPDAKPSTGRASIAEGFPTETQLPLNSGGVAPNRMDFNGLFHMLSAFSFWQQSGGLFTYDGEKLNYAPPAIVFHNQVLWWCVKENGPNSENGKVEPGTDDDYWLDLLTALSFMSNSSVGSDVGDLKWHYGTEAPAGWFPMTGYKFDAAKYPKLYAKLGNVNVTPDASGMFIRCYDPTGKVDPEGATRGFGSKQDTAGVRILGNIGWHVNRLFTNVTGAFVGVRGVNRNAVATQPSGGEASIAYASLDTNRLYKASTEFRPPNMCLSLCIKHD